LAKIGSGFECYLSWEQQIIMERKSAIRPISVDRITQSILVLRGHKVLLDSDLAALYDVPTKVLLQAVKRNIDRFPDDFMLQLGAEEWAALRSQFVTLKTGRGQHRKYLPYAFTEQGVAMLSSVLKSKRAIAVNIEIMRAFVRMRELLASNKTLAQQLQKLERKVASHDVAIADVLRTIRELMNPLPLKSRPIGFTAKFDESD
jgi:phage regulator Rha-like protein